jgi:5-methylthioribose kinase
MVPELSPDNAGEWLKRHGFPSDDLRFVELGGGVSNRVILAEGSEFRAVLKQSLSQLRTEQGWFSDRSRIFREAAAMQFIGGGCVPRILAEDPETFTIAMDAAPASAEMWKTRLFRGEMNFDVARAAGMALGSFVAASWHNDEARRLFGDQTVFGQLRLDPYYRFTAARRADAAEYIETLLERSRGRRVSLVHGDWSPKNLLVDGTNVTNAGLWAIDWEVVHYGDPSFDVGFLLNHLLMKSIAMPEHRFALANLATAFAESCAAQLPSDAKWVVPAGLDHLPALLLARVEGKSPAEYFDAAMRERAGSLAIDLMRRPAMTVAEVFER